MKDLNNNEITEAQLEELDKLLVELKSSEGNPYKDFGGGADDELMIKAVTNAARYANGEENTFIEDLVQVGSSYTK